MKLLTKEQQELYENAQLCYISKKKLENKYVKDEKYRKVSDHSHYTAEYRVAAHSVCNLKYSNFTPIPSPVVFPSITQKR